MAVANKTSDTISVRKETRELGSCEDYICNITSFFNSPELSDITLKVGTKRFYAHKFILAVHSEVFRAMFSESAWMESKQQEVSLEEKEECAEVFGEFLKFLYSGRLAIHNENLVALYRLADKYNVKGLHSSCEQFIQERIEAQTDFNAAISWLSFAEEYHLQAITLRLYDVLRVNFQKVVSSPMWLSLQLRQVCNLLDTWKIVVEDEFTIYNAVIKWIEAEIHRHDKKKVPDAIYELLKYIRPAHLTPDQLITIEKSCNGFPPDCKKNIQALLFDGYKYHTLRQIDKYSMEFTSVPQQPRLYLSSAHTTPQDTSNGSGYNFHLSTGCKKPSESGSYWEILPNFETVSQQPPKKGNNELSQSFSICSKFSEEQYIRYNVTASTGSKPGWYYHMAIICYDPQNSNEILHVVTSNGKVPSSKVFELESPANFASACTTKIACIIHVWN